MNPYQYVISLRIWHPTFPKEEISEMVGRCAKHSWTVGTPRISPKGNPLGGLHKSTYWTTELTEGTMISDPIEVEQAIAEQMGCLAQASLGICLDYYPWKRD